MALPAGSLLCAIPVSYTHLDVYKRQVLIDEVDEDGAIGRSKADAPEIDGAVYLNDATHLQAGQIVRARVDEADEYDLWASLI